MVEIVTDRFALVGEDAVRVLYAVGVEYEPSVIESPNATTRSRMAGGTMATSTRVSK
ncbi:hypothetical protein [Tenggerimyces flavus]|uniref:Uncharacterized protein n=1 Tax=Tenggerimyces flavus TaxID=1708749 RepID=A0ABV7Y4E4_9ACTN|nr:hypothetical protein [Tenggerimyces flavus]MBM7790315.1 hypothetical protein [Tenggerimyces flavus]